MTHDWQKYRLVELTPRGKKHTIVDGPFGSNLKTEHYRSTGIPIVTSGFVTSGRFRADNYLFVDLRKFDQEKRSAVYPGDIVMAKIGARSGASAILPIDHEVGILSGNTLKITIDEDRHSTAYVALVLSWLYERGELEVLRSTGAQPAISMPLLKRLTLSMPCHVEQSRIAGVIAEADKLIQSIERLIVKKQAIKQGMMQQLLTGRTRLPGFSGIWEEIRLGDHVSYVKTVALSRAQLDAKSPLKYLHYGDIHTRPSILLDAASEEMPRASAELAARAGWLRKGDLVFADASEDPVGVGKSIEITTVPDAGVIPGLHTIAARFDKSVLADGFKAYLQFIPSFRIQLLRLVAGTKVLATTRSYLSSITMALPDVLEQKAIADVLLDTEQEILALQVRLSKAQDIKTGMMQQLLTGRIRLPVEASS